MFRTFKSYGLFTTDPNVYGYTEEKYYIEASTVEEEVAAGDYQVVITNMRNPRSVEPTDNFVLSTKDSNDYWIGNGTGGNVFMQSGGSFE